MQENILEEFRLLKKAKEYPFPVPSFSYFFLNGEAFVIKELIESNLGNSKIIYKNAVFNFSELIGSTNSKNLPHLRELTPVLAYGSNGSVQQLVRKFSGFSTFTFIPVIKAKLYDFDVVYSAHFAAYGAVPLTLQFSKGTVLHTFITFLTDAQLKRMHQSESVGTNYYYGELINVNINFERNILNEIYSYFSLHGCLFIDNTFYSSADVLAIKRSFPSLHEEGILRKVQYFLDGRKSNLDEFILENIRDDEIRRVRTRLLEKEAKEIDYNDIKVLKGK